MPEGVPEEAKINPAQGIDGEVDHGGEDGHKADAPHDELDGVQGRVGVISRAERHDGEIIAHDVR